MTTMDHTNYKRGRAKFNVPASVSRILRLAYHAMKVCSERAALHEMPDYLLKDLGIARSEIDRYTSMSYSQSSRDGPDAGMPDERF